MVAKKVQKFPPIYENSFETAMECGETEQYNASRDLNVECAKAINKALAEHYSNNRMVSTKSACSSGFK